MSTFPKQKAKSPKICVNASCKLQQNDYFSKLDNHENVASLVTVSAPGGPETCHGERCGQCGSSPAALLLSCASSEEVPCVAQSLLLLEERQPQESGSYFLVPRTLTPLQKRAASGPSGPLKGCVQTRCILLGSEASFSLH